MPNYLALHDSLIRLEDSWGVIPPDPLFKGGQEGTFISRG